jgi:hypothetical protein
MAAYEEHRDYKSATSWMEKVPPLDEAAASFALDYAEKRYARMIATLDGADEKADAILRLSGGAGAAFTIAAGFASPSGDWILALPMIPLFVAALLAVIARWPTTVPDGPRVCDLVDDVRDEGLPEVRGLLPAAYHCAIVGMRIVADRKAKIVAISSAFLCATILTLCSVLIYRYCHPLPLLPAPAASSDGPKNVSVRPFSFCHPLAAAVCEVSSWRLS